MCSLSASDREKRDVEGCAQMSKGECVLICQDIALSTESMTKLIALNDMFVWMMNRAQICSAGEHCLITQPMSLCINNFNDFLLLTYGKCVLLT